MKGVFIPDYILKDSSLSFWERVLLATLVHWNKSNKDKSFSQKTVCERWGLSKSSCSRALRGLLQKGRIEKGAGGSYVVLSCQNDNQGSCQNDNRKVVKMTTKSYQNDNPHHINSKLVKESKEKTPPEIEKKEEVVLNEKEKEKHPPNSGPPPLPLWQQAAAAMVEWYEKNEGQTGYIYGTTHVKDWETLKAMIVECCAYYGPESDWKMREAIKNPAKFSGLVVRWINNDKRFNGGRKKSQKKTGGASVDNDFLINLQNELNDNNI